MVRRTCSHLVLLGILFHLTAISQCFNQVYLKHPLKYRSSVRPQDCRCSPMFFVVVDSHWTLTSKICMAGDAKGDYYGESAGSYMVQEFK